MNLEYEPLKCHFGGGKMKTETLFNKKKKKSQKSSENTSSCRPS